MNDIFAALALEAVGGFAIAGAITAWMRSHLNHTVSVAAPVDSVTGERNGS